MKMIEMIHVFKIVYKNYPDAVYAIRLIKKEDRPVDFEYLYANPASEQMTGISPLEIVGTTYNTYFGGKPDGPLLLYQEALKRKQAGKTYLYRQETDRMYEVTYTPVDEEICLIEARNVDTDSLQCEGKANMQLMQSLFKERQALYDAIPANITRGLVERDKITPLAWNRIFNHITGFQAKECRDFMVTVYEEDRDFVIKYLGEQAVHGKPVNMQHRIIDKNGMTHWVHKMGFKIGERGGISEYVFVSFVIDKQIKTEKAIYFQDKSNANTAFFSSPTGETFTLQDCLRSPGQNKEEFRKEANELSNAIGMLFMSVYRVDLTGNWYLALKQSEIETGILPESGTWQELVQTYMETMTEKHQPAYRNTYQIDNLRSQLKTDNPVIIMEIPSNIGGKVRWLRHSIMLTAMGENNAETCAYMIQDVTAEREMERQKQEALRIAFDSAQKANEAKTHFLSSMSHDIRTPMNAIIGMTAIAGRHMDDRVRVKDCLNKISISSKHLLALINEVLDMSKIEAGKVELGNEKFMISELFDNVVTIIQQQMKEKNQGICVRIGQLAHEAVSGDPYRLQQVFMNLLSNAVKYTPEGGKICVELKEMEMQGLDSVRYQVIIEDNGIGMSKEFQKVMFEPFSRAEDTRTNKIYGTGLGMAIAQNIIRLMNGEISVESELNKGTRIIVEFVLGLQHIDEGILKSLEHLPILIADNNLSVCKSVCDMVTSIGMRGEYVLSGEACIRKAVDVHKEGRDYFACLMEWDMPGINSIEVIHRLRKVLGQEFPIIIMSSYERAYIEEEVKHAGATAFISKPLVQSKLAYLFYKLLGDGKKQIEKNTQINKNGKRVLLVEDNEMNMEIAAEIIGDTGVFVEKAVNGEDAVEKVEQSPEGYFDMIFMDIQMPRMDGYQAARVIRGLKREDVKQLPIIAMTANAFREDILKTKEAGMDGHIAKPIDINDLYKTLKEWLE